MRLSPDHHLHYAWHVHELASDFDLLDVWRFPLAADPQLGETFDAVQSCFLEQLEHPEQFGGIAGWLFRLRASMGQAFGWDETPTPLPIPGCTETSLRTRLAALTPPLQPAEIRPSKLPFSPVYTTPTEALYEISNATVHALLHLGWVPVGDGPFTVQMAIYSKSRGRLGQAYMALIAPFRHGIVYPTMMRWMQRQWQHYRTSLSPI